MNYCMLVGVILHLTRAVQGECPVTLGRMAGRTGFRLVTEITELHREIPPTLIICILSDLRGVTNQMYPVFGGSSVFVGGVRGDAQCVTITVCQRQTGVSSELE